MEDTFIFIGRSGSGKGTQASLLIDYLKKETGKEVFYLQTGAAFREFIKGNSLTHTLSREIYESSRLQPEFLTIAIWANLLIENMKDGIHLVLDGTPRRIHEAEILVSAMRFYRRSTPYIVYIDVPRKWAEERLISRGRSDDTAEEIGKRMDWFEDEVMEAVHFFKTSPEYRFLHVNGEGSVEEVHQEILKKYRGER